MIENERHVLIVFPHPDDEAFGVSGTIAAYVKKGIPVTYACLTLGEMGRNLGNPPFATRESLPHIRKKELQDSANALGIQDLRMFGFRDKTLEFEDEEKLAGLMAELMDELNPSLIITFYPGYSVHPDHEATEEPLSGCRTPAEGEKAEIILRRVSRNCEEELGKPDIIHDVSDTLTEKLASIRAHRSQTAFFIEDVLKRVEEKDPATLKRLQTERFWTYKFHD